MANITQSMQKIEKRTLREQMDPQTKKILKNNIIFPLSTKVQDTDAATAAKYGNFFIADKPYQVIAISEVHRTAGSDAGAVTLSVEKCLSGVVVDSGVDLLNPTKFNLKATAATPQFAILTDTLPSLNLIKGDRLILKDTGVLTAVNDVCVTVYLKET